MLGITLRIYNQARSGVIISDNILRAISIRKREVYSNKYMLK